VTRRTTIIAASLALCLPAQAQAEDKEPFAQIELGAATERSIQENASSFGPTAAVEPFTLSDKVEFMIGAGPQVSYATFGGATKLAGEIELEWMIWPTADRKLGWFVAPTYSYSFSRGHEQSIGFATGLIIPIR
jgi:hypothetical protein